MSGAAPLDIQAQPWEKCSYSLVSWWEMQKFSAAGFMQTMQLLGSLPLLSEELSPGELADPRAVDGSNAVLGLLKADCERLGLEISAGMVEGMMYDFAMKVPITVRYYKQRCDHLSEVIRLEMEKCLFFHIPASASKSLFNQPELFGPEVSQRFPGVLDDAREAGSCLALDRPTACVFHLMRVMETGVQEFGNSLGVAVPEEKCWQNILDEVNKAIKSLPSKDSRTADLSRAAAALYSVKVAWRNQVMHPKDVYTNLEAAEILQHVKSFMGELARIM